MRQHLTRMLAYGHWADELLAARLTQNDVPGECLRLFEHVLQAQRIWCDRVRGEPANHELWPAPDPGTWAQRMATLRTDWLKVIAEHEPDELIAYRTSSGTLYETALADIVTHLAIHGQHHRAQVALELRRAGIAPPALDFIAYVRLEPAPAA